MDKKILISGAGPVGLAAALFLRSQKIPVRIFDVLTEPHRQSKALAVNPRTLQLLEGCGVTEKMLERGLRISTAQFWRDGEVFAELSISQLHHRYPFMLALSQATTERLLTKALIDLETPVERGMQVTHCQNTGEGVELEVQDQKGRKELLRGMKLLAADGAHSLIRHELNIQFDGSTDEQEWSLLDIPLQTKLREDCAHAFFPRQGGFVFMIRVVEDLRQEKSITPLWRIISNFADPLEHLREIEAEGTPLWESTFKVSHRLNRRLSVGNIFFMGDAAHIHSPVGARGMNLGIEDAWTFSELFREGRLREYDSLRRRVDRKVVRNVDRLSHLAVGDSALLRQIRRPVLEFLTHFSPLRQNLIRAMTGTDHSAL
jgi:2-polyprenyl-6-methoxyphenol hydroxylase-like FAD-dependent oxidoreductase